MARTKRTTPLPRTIEEIKTSIATPLAPGVFLVRQDTRVTGLHVHPGGIAMLDAPDYPWRPEPPIVKVKRGIIRSRVHIKFADGTKTVVRPYKPGFKGLIQVGQIDSLGNFTMASTDARNNSGADSFVAPIIVVAAIVLFPVSLVFLVRELLGTSARAKQADLLITAIRAVIPA